MQTQIRVLAEDEIQEIHERSLHLLEKTGMRIETRKGREILARAGAVVNKESEIVTFPKKVVENAIQTADRNFQLTGRRPKWSFQVNRNDCTLCLDGEGTLTIDRRRQNVRPSSLEDLSEITRLADALDEVGVYWRMITPHEIGDRMHDFVAYVISVFRNFTKHVQDPLTSPAQAPWLIDILETLFGDRNVIRNTHPFSTLLCPQSPLILEEAYTDAYLALKGLNLPVAVMPMAFMGATAPASMIATVIQCNCEVLGTLCLIQAHEPGAPFLYAPALSLMDPRSGRYFSGAVENAVMSTAAVEMARFYGFPVMASILGTDTAGPSVQGGYERAINALPLLAAPDIAVGPGLFGGDMILSFDQLLIDTEIFRMFRQFRRGVAADSALFLDHVIEQTGPGGNYIEHETTRKQVRSGEWYIPRLGVHESIEAGWPSAQPRLRADVREKVVHLLKTHRPLELDAAVEKELQRILDRARGVPGRFNIV